MNAKDHAEILSLDKLIADLSGGIKMKFEVKRMQPLFKDEADYKEFTDRHDQYKVRRGDLATYEGNVFLGNRCRFHHNEGGTRRRGWFPALQLLQQQQRKPVGDRDLFHKGDQVPASGQREDRLPLFHRLRRGPLKGGLHAG